MVLSQARVPLMSWQTSFARFRSSQMIREVVVRNLSNRTTSDLQIFSRFACLLSLVPAAHWHPASLQTPARAGVKALVFLHIAGGSI